MTAVDVTVVVLTFNGVPHLERVLRMVEAQDYVGTHETLVIDSGSTDGSLEILARFPDVRVERIPNSEFGHGKTRDLAVHLATGRFVAFLTQDAVPADEHWLSELLAPFAINDRVAIVTGRQIPRGTAFPLQKYDIIHTFASIGSSGGTVIFGGANAEVEAKEAARAAFHSDVNAAVRRDLALTTLPFRDVPYSEDQLMGREVLDSGMWKAYAGRAAVEHSNDLTLREYGKRLFDETVALRRLGHDYSGFTLPRTILSAVRGTLGDTLRILFDSDYGVGRKFKWWFVNPLFQLQRWFSIYRAARVDLNDRAAHRSRSLEHERKRQSRLVVQPASSAAQPASMEPDASN